MAMHLVANRSVGVERPESAEARPREQGVWRRALAALAVALGGGWEGTHMRRKHMRILETLSLGAKKQLLLVVCDGERLLVGTGAEGVQTIVRMGSMAADMPAVQPGGRR